MSNKEQFLKFLNESPDGVFDTVYPLFGLDDWCDALVDFPEAQAVFMKRQKLFDKIDFCKYLDEPEEQRQEILDKLDEVMRNRLDS